MANPDEIKIKELHDIISNKISESLRELLETKHLYQSLHIEWNPVITPVKAEQEKIKAEAQEALKVMMARSSSRIRSGQQEECKDDAESHVTRQMLYYINAPWDLRPSRMPNRESLETVGPDCLLKVRVKMPTVKLFCQKCNRVEAYKIEYVEDHLNSSSSKDIAEQIFVTSYRCQSCESNPEIFMINRLSNKLTLTGRSIIEFVEVPKVIPKDLKQYYSGAVVAFQSRQTLVGLFLLRVLIEQQGYIVCKSKTLKADKAIEYYMKSLPDEVKASFPSFSELYSNLSFAIHNADENDKLFKDSLEKIQTHYEARLLYEKVGKKKKEEGK